MSSPFQKVLGTSIVAAGKAGDVVRQVMKGGKLDVVEKTGADDVQTAADRIANDIIVGSLKREFPSLTVIGEEGDAAPIEDGLYVAATDHHELTRPIPRRLADATLEQMTVWVDPLDATKEYTEGFLDHVTVLIGIAMGDEAVGGVIHQPFYGFEKAGDFEGLGRTLYGVVGAGAGGSIVKKPPPPGELIVTTSRSHGNSLVTAALEAVKPTKVIKVGGSGHKVLLLIEGRAHAYVFPTPGCKKWDTCGPEAILHAMGGKLTDIRGIPYPYGKNAPFLDEWGVLATGDEAFHAEILAQIPDELKGK